MSSIAADVAMVNRRKKQRINVELHVDRRKILQQEIDKLYQELGKLSFEGGIPEESQSPIIKKEIQIKLDELESIEASPNDATNIDELTAKLAEFVADHMKGSAEGVVSDQIIPLMCRIMASTLTKMIGEEGAMVLLVNERIQSMILYCMVMGFSYYNLLKTHGIKIVTDRVQMTESEMTELEYMAQQNRERVEQILFGANPLGTHGEDPEEIV